MIGEYVVLLVGHSCQLKQPSISPEIALGIECCFLFYPFFGVKTQKGENLGPLKHSSFTRTSLG